MKVGVLFFTWFLGTHVWAYSGFDECQNSKLGIVGSAHKSISYSWKYSYKNKGYVADLSEWLTSSPPWAVEHVSETILSIKCNGQNLLERTSIRHVILRDSNSNVVIEGDLNCKGTLPSGIPQEIFYGYNPCN